MSNDNTVRAWKEEGYPENLTEEQRSELPKNPAGIIEVPDETADAVGGGRFTRRLKKKFGATKGFFCKGIRGSTKGVFCNTARRRIGL